MQELSATVEHIKNMQNDSWKYEGIDGLVTAGLITDPEKWREKIEEKCGASVKIGSADPVKKHEHVAEEKIKDKSFKLFLDKQ